MARKSTELSRIIKCKSKLLKEIRVLKGKHRERDRERERERICEELKMKKCLIIFDRLSQC